MIRAVSSSESGLLRCLRYEGNGAFLNADTHWPPVSSGVVLAARTAPAAAIATATAAIVTSSGASTITEMSYSPDE